MVDATAQRVFDVQFQGKPIDNTAEFLSATTSYRIADGGRFPKLPADHDILRTKVMVQNALLNYLKTSVSDKTIATGHWCLKPQHAYSDTFETSPVAEAHLQQVAGFKPEAYGITDNGFLKLKLHF